MPSAADTWRSELSNLKVWKRSGQRAVHKPLLTLLLLARADAGGTPRVRFDDIDTRLADLLREFGPPRKSYHPEYPFWHLQSSGFWTIEHAERLPTRKGKDAPSRSTLRDHVAIGCVPEPLWTALTGDPALRAELVQHLLDDFWPQSLHDELRRVIGLPDRDVVAADRTRRKRDPRFRDAVLRAYERRCAVCGYDGRLGRDEFGLEAAHIRWHCEGGPDEVENGLALCSFHHTAFDRGALGLGESMQILVSADVAGGEAVTDWLLRYANAPLRPPQSADWNPAPGHIEWHQREVFRDPARS